MKIKYILLNTLSLAFLVACNSHKESGHHHDSDSDHSHSIEKTSNNETNYFENYQLEDSNYGTKTVVSIKGNKRVMVTNSLPNHKTGNFPNQGNPNTISAQNKTSSFPATPKYIGKPQWIREPGVALNGIKFEPGTAEVVECDSGENYRVEAIQNVIDLGLDFNNAHVQPTGEYHYHGSPTSIINAFDKGEDLVHIGFAHDGFPIYVSKSEKYTPSFKLLDGNREGEDCTYENPMESRDISVGGHHDGTYGSDYEYVANSGDLDECNGITVKGKYMYLVTKDFPYVGRCLMGEIDNKEQKGPPNGQQGQNGRPSTSDILAQLDINKDGKISKDEAKGPLLQDFTVIDKNKDGFITKKELENGAKGGNKQRPPRR
jgi:hypothetical protein